jgi:hypothetical protein
VVTVQDTVPTVVDTVVVRARPEDRTTQIGKDAATWTWEDLRNYVVTQIERRFGQFPRNPIKESGIFKGFLNRWGAQAGPIAITAFELYDGFWKGAPIQVTRFCQNSDRFFAEPVAALLR